jgi:hypothetical protein
MGATTSRAAAPTGLLDLPDALLERILVEASDGGNFSSLYSGGGRWGELRAARRACRRLHAVVYAAAREFSLSLDFLWPHDDAEQLAPLALLPRLGALERVRLVLNNDRAYYGDDNPDLAEGHDPDAAMAAAMPGMAAEIARAVHE